MNEIESFLINLNLIQTNNNKNEANLSTSSSKEINEKIADYTLNGGDGGGWKILKSIYENKLEINEIFGEKLINLLINTCAQLVCNLPVESKYNLNKHSFQTRYSSQIYLNLFDDSFDREEMNLNDSESIGGNNKENNNRNDDEAFKYSIKLSNSNGTLFDLIIICLNLYIKYNDGTNNTILNDKNNNKSLVLNTFCDSIFNKVNNDQSDSQNINIIRLIYLKFLNKLFKLNFKNLNNKTSSMKSTTSPIIGNLPTQSSIVFKQASNHLFIEQFKLISLQNFNNNVDQLIYIVKMIVNYLYNFAKSFKFITDSSLFKSNYYNSTNMYSFECLVQLLNETLTFLFDNILKLDEELVILKNDQNFFDFNKYKINNKYWKRLTMILIEMKSFKNNYQHAQICLRSKHTHISCKINLYEIENRHDDISLIQKSCLFAKLTDILFKNLVSNFASTDNSNSDCVSKLILQIKSNRLIQMIKKFGVCTCINLDELINMQTIRTNKYFFNQNICSIIFDYLLSVFNYTLKSSNVNSPVDKQQSSSSSSTSKITKRRSIFFPLMVDESLTDPAKSLNKDLVNFASNIIVESSDKDNDLFKQFYDIIIKLDEKSILVIKYLTSSLNKYTKYLPHLLPHNDQSHNDKQEDLEVNLSIKYRWFIHEIFYLFKNVLDYLNNQTGDSQTSLLIFEMICKYLGEFLILSNSNTNLNTKNNNVDLDKSSNKSSTTSTPYQTDRRNSSVGLSSSSTFHGRTGLGENYYTVHDSASNQQIEFKINTKFIEFMNDNSIKLYDVVSNLCSMHNQTPYLAISLCSQLIFFKNSQQQEQYNHKTTSFNLNIEQHLSKCLIDKINSNLNLLNSTHVLDILVELYVKCSTFRLCLNECNLFHSNLMNCLTQTFQSLETSSSDTNTLKYLELLLDVIFVYFYYNRKVSFKLFLN